MSYRLHAQTHADARFNDGIDYDDWFNVIDAWERADIARRAGHRPLVRYYAVREVADEGWSNSQPGPNFFVDTPDASNRLTDREYAEVIGSLQIVRDNARAAGREPADVVSALAKLVRGCTPSTNGLTFNLIEG